MSLNIELLESSFSIVKEHATEFTETFYTNLFTDYPEVKPLFTNSHMEEQGKKLFSSLVLTINSLRKPDFLAETLRGLGTRHIKYGVLPQHYPMVGNSLLKSLESSLEHAWTNDVKQAWLEAYTAVTQLMLEGSDPLFMGSLADLPMDLPIPLDDGACDHLIEVSLPSVALHSTQGRQIDLSVIPGYVVLYCYPMTGQPGVPLPNGWEQIPGARGCTPQSCAFRDLHQELSEIGAQVFGLSTQSTKYQVEAANRLHLPFELLSDLDLNFAKALKLPMFKIDEKQLIKRITLIANGGKIVKVFYPVFPPDKNANEVIQWLKNSAVQSGT
jgi:peroxiredoxin/hemoglobin-like flavoprotein